MRLLLARHARTASNVAALLDTAPPGPELDAYGHAQALRLAAHTLKGSIRYFGQGPAYQQA